MLLMVASVVITMILALDVNNDATQTVQFDWIETLCSLLSGAASVILGVVAIVQGEKANKLNEELAEIDRMQFENASATANYPLIKFNRTQLVDWERKEFVLQFVDVKEVAIKEIFISDLHFYPYSEDYRAEEEDESIVVQEDGARAQAKFVADADAADERGKASGKHGKAGRRSEAARWQHAAERGAPKDERDGFYEATIKANPEWFSLYDRFCLEFNLEAVNEAEVAIIYKFKLLVEGAGRMKRGQRAERRKRKLGRVKIFHQFYEIEATMGEEKWEEG